MTDISLWRCVPWLLLLLTLSACVRVPEPGAPGFRENAKSTSVAMQLLHTSDRAVLPLLPVKMGEQTYWWVLDTGSSHNLVATGLAEKLKMRAVASSEMATIGGRQLSTHYQLPPLKIGALQLDKQSASAVDLSHLSVPGYTVSGILGVPALSRLKVLLDFPQRRVMLAETLPAFALPSAAGIPFQLRGGVPVAAVNIDGRRAEVILDTGNATSLVLLPDFTRFSPQQSFSFIETRDLGGNIPARLAQVGQLQLGDSLFTDIPVSLPLQNHRYRQSAVAGSLGNGLLGQQPVVFDFPGRKLLVAGRAGNQIADGSFGFRLAQSNMIEVVLENSPAQQSGLQVGERIIAVDGRPTAGAHEIWPHLNGRQQVQLTLQRGNQLRQLSLRRGRFLPALRH
ncbi:MAG: aspartyl protease family protein [Thiolinea sp.]